MSHRFLSSLSLAAGLVLVPSVIHAQYDCTGISQTSNTTLASVTVATTLSNPLFVAAPPGDPVRIFIVERGGTIRIHKKGTSASTLSTFLDISTKVDSETDGEMGLLGLAFDPNYASTRFFWVNYTETISGQIYTVVARYTANAVDPDRADSASEVRVLRFAQPESNHNGGMLLFGMDGFLYVFTGDGGGGGDAHGTCGNGQSRTTLLGKILRIDVRGVDPAATAPDCGLAGANYGVPQANPFRDGSGIGFCDEIYAYGLRNPWRSTMDQLTGDFYVADVGQNCWEEVNFAAAGTGAGVNYGWRQMEGLNCYNPAQQFTCTPSGAICAGSPPCNDPSLKRPVVAFDHSTTFGCAVTGGYVYRGCRMKNYPGTYFYSDYCAAFVKTFVVIGGVATNQTDVSSEVNPSGAFGDVSSFGVDAQGEMYFTSLGGTVRKIVPPFAALEVSAQGAAALLRLSKTGDWTWEDLFASTDVPVSFYRVYRGSVNGSYTCIFKPSVPRWTAGGDPAIPPPGVLYAYVVTAVNASGVETARGTTGSFNAATCP
jgi:glucose/arabinose dehydrogenase